MGATWLLPAASGSVLAVAALLAALQVRPPTTWRHVTALPPPRDTFYNTSAGTVTGKINVHLVPHSHDDVGWLKTVDQYFTGSRSEIQLACVEFTLDTVVDQLLKNRDRKFVEVEQAFFTTWWRKQSDVTQAAVRELIQLGQLEFINGGWCMHDEAAAHYIDMIDQTSLGHRFLAAEFGVVPRIAWQIDPFGHSAVQGYLLGAEAGFDAVFFARADYQDVARRNKERSSEFVWRASETLHQTQIFGGHLYYFYMPPQNFSLEFIPESGDTFVQDDPELNDVNVKERVDDFVKAAQEQAEHTRTNHVMWAMGGDFAYANAIAWFRNIDKLIHYVNLDGRVHALYSTPSIYLDAKFDANESWPLKKGDFFPYADCPHCYWTGYFTSRPAFKGYIRQCSALLMAARILEVAGQKASPAGTGGGRDQGRPIPAQESGGRGVAVGSGRLERAMAVAQHHDGVSGTAQQHVTNDYIQRLFRGAIEAEMVLTSAAEALFQTQESCAFGGDQQQAAVEGREDPPPFPRPWTRKASQGHSTAVDGATEVPGRRSRRAMAAEMPATAGAGCLGEVGFSTCPLLNISFCPPSQADVASGKTLVIVAFNPLAWARVETVRVPVVSADVAVTDGDGTAIEAQVVPEANLVPFLRNFYIEAHAGAGAFDPKFDSGIGRNLSAPLSLVFRASLPPLGHATFFVSAAKGNGAAAVMSEEVFFPPDASSFTVLFRDGHGSAHSGGGISVDAGAQLRAEFRLPSGQLSRLHLPRTPGQPGRSVAFLEASLQCYNTLGADAGREPSGAYIFRPHNSSGACPNASLIDDHTAGQGGGTHAELASTADVGAAGAGKTPYPPIPRLRVFTGPVVVEVHRHDTDWGAQVFRFYKDEKDVELHYTVGPVPLSELGSDGGREVAQRFSTDIPSKSEFFTDSNGRDYLRRVRDARPDWELEVTEPIAGNYYPLNSGTYISGAGTDLSLLVDRAAGGSSLKEGELEVMLHRRLKTDDNRGVREPLNETVTVGNLTLGLTVTGTLHLSALPSPDAVSWRRGKAQRKFSPLHLTFAAVDASPELLRSQLVAPISSTLQPTAAFSLPPNVAIITLQKLDTFILLRLAHLYQEGEDELLSTLATVDLQKLLSGLEIKHAEELSLTANQKRSEVRQPLQWKVQEEARAKAEKRGRALDPNSLIVELGPMEIRTFALYTSFS